MAERRRIKREETQADQTHRQQKPQEETKHPETYERDLNPERMKGQNIGQRAEEVEPGTRRASDMKDVVAHLDGVRPKTSGPGMARRRRSAAETAERRAIDSPGARGNGQEPVSGCQLAELREIPVLPPGARLEQGATYLNLRDPAREPFTATGEMRAGPDDWLVPKSEVPHPYWNRLTRAEPPHRRT